MGTNEDAGFGVHDNDDEGSQSSELGMDDSQLSDKATPLSPEMNSALTKLASRLCAICQRLYHGEVKLIWYAGPDAQVSEELDYHPSLSSLRESCDAGCPLCMEVAKAFEQHIDMKPEVRDTVVDSWYITCCLEAEGDSWFYEVKGIRFQFTLRNSNGQPDLPKLGGNKFMYFFPAEVLGLGPEYLEYAAGATNAMSTPNIGLAQNWLNMCLNDCNCRDKAQPRFLPTRLIEVRTHEGKSPNTTARLCEAQDFSADASYLTLSHCWGGNTLFTLTKANLETLKRDIPVHQLPDLFKDALHMTSQLGMKYIWIDCLCIIQDSQDDWAYEAARMGDVYHSAICNIASSGYKDGKTGLFKDRTPIPLLNFPVYLDLVLVADKETTGHDVRTPYKGIYVRADDEEFFNAIAKGPLNTRCWVAQERALSPGILHFTPKQMWWECKNHVASESFPHIALTWDLAQQFGPNALRLLNAKSGIRDVYLAWNNFVGFYAGTALTVKSDRFPALTGIARAFNALTKDNLIAGTWEGDLIQSLAWRVDHQDRAKEIPSTQLAPSWSWAFLCVPHESAYSSYEHVRPVCFCRRILSDDPGFRSDLDYTSSKKSAVRGLEVTGSLRKLPVKVEELLGLLEWEDSVDTLFVYYDVADSSLFSAEDVANHEQAWHWEDPTHMLPVIQDGQCVRCLLLNSVPGAEHPNTFRRLGVVHIWFEDEESCDEFLGIGNGNGKSKPSVVFEDCRLQDVILI